MFTVTADTAAFTLAGSAASVDVDIEDQGGAAAVSGVDLGDITITRVGDGTTITYNVLTDYSSALVSSFVTANTLTEAITPVFNNAVLSATLSGNAISLSGKNAVSAAGQLGNGTGLPSGYEVTATDGTAYSFTDPDGAAVAAYGPEALADLVIAEWNNGAVVPGNKVTYTVTLELEALLSFDEGYVSASDGVLVDVAGTTVTLTVNNGCVAAPPCAAVGAALGNHNRNSKRLWHNWHNGYSHGSIT